MNTLSDTGILGLIETIDALPCEHDFYENEIAGEYLGAGFGNSDLFLTNTNILHLEAIYYAYTFNHTYPLFISQFAHDSQGRRLSNTHVALFWHKATMQNDSDHRHELYAGVKQFKLKYNWNPMTGEFDKKQYLLDHPPLTGVSLIGNTSNILTGAIR